MQRVWWREKGCDSEGGGRLAKKSRKSTSGVYFNRKRKRRVVVYGSSSWVYWSNKRCTYLVGVVTKFGSVNNLAKIFRSKTNKSPLLNAHKYKALLTRHVWKTMETACGMPATICGVLSARLTRSTACWPHARDNLGVCTTCHTIWFFSPSPTYFPHTHPTLCFSLSSKILT